MNAAYWSTTPTYDHARRRLFCLSASPFRNPLQMSSARTKIGTNLADSPLEMSPFRPTFSMSSCSDLERCALLDVHTPTSPTYRDFAQRPLVNVSRGRHGIERVPSRPTGSSWVSIAYAVRREARTDNEATTERDLGGERDRDRG